jgi:hydrogenase maturation protease
MCDALPDTRRAAVLKLVGVGNRWRGDDAAGLEVARIVARRAPAGVAVLEHEREPVDLIDTFDGACAVWLIDAVRSGAPPGTLHRFDVSEQALPAGLFGVSTHLLGLADAVELARALDKLPARVIVHGIEGGSFEAGGALSPAVASATRALAATLESEVAGL